MIQLLEFTADQVIIIAMALPLVAVCLFIFIIPWLRKGSSSKWRRYISYLVNPPRISSLKSVSLEDDAEQKQGALRREIKTRLFFVYLGIAIFLISFMISEFYEVFLDILLPVTQGNTGEIRTVTSVIFQSPFSAGWIGDLPWYGQLPLPAGFGTYHESWSWIFFTAALTDNPVFLSNIVTTLLLFSFVVGIVFLAPLAMKTIRQSFLPSMFFFTTGMAIFTKTAFGCFAQAWALAFGNAQIHYGIMHVSGEMIPNLIEGIAFGMPIILAIFALFIMLGRNLWKMHYPDSKSKTWFMVYIAIVFWLGLALTMMVA